MNEENKTTKQPRLLTPEDIEIRVQSIKKTSNGLGAILLLYKNARVDMAILDEWIGPMNWQRRHLRDNANCILSLWDKEKSQWIEKEDTGTESNTEAEKGLASDSFKRAGFNWGIGRELYTSPFIWIDLKENEVFNDKLKLSIKFSVQSIDYDEHRKIISLVIVDNRDDIRYTLKSSGGKRQETPERTTPSTTRQDDPGQAQTPQRQKTPGQAQKATTATQSSPAIAGDIQVTFGKHKGEMLSDVFRTDRQYCEWMLTSDKINSEVQKAIQRFIDVETAAFKDSPFPMT